MTLDEYEQALNRRYRGALLGKRFLTHLAVIAGDELGEPVVIEHGMIHSIVEPIVSSATVCYNVHQSGYV